MLPRRAQLKRECGIVPVDVGLILGMCGWDIIHDGLDIDVVWDVRSGHDNGRNPWICVLFDIFLITGSISGIAIYIGEIAATNCLRAEDTG